MARTLQIAANRVTSFSPQKARTSLDSLARLAPPSFGIDRERAEVGGVPCEWFTPANWDGKRTFVHLHGGGYALCSSVTHRLMISDMVRATGARGLAVEYRLAPEHPFPAGFKDCIAAYLGVLNQGVGPRGLFVTGDSAGAALAVALLVHLRDHEHPLPRAAVLMSPWTDLNCPGATIEAHSAYDYLNAKVLKFFADLYLDGHDPMDERASPVHAELSGLPPLLIQAGSAEMFLTDIVRLRDRAAAAGVDVTYQPWEGMVHAFQGFTLFLPEARAAFKAIGEFVDDKLGDGTRKALENKNQSSKGSSSEGLDGE